MKKSLKNAGLVVTTPIKAGGMGTNHNSILLRARKAGLLVKTATKAGGMGTNHSRSLLSA